jgi:hypothetical protein
MGAVQGYGPAVKLIETSTWIKQTTDQRAGERKEWAPESSPGDDGEDGEAKRKKRDRRWLRQAIVQDKTHLVR